jgi:hypothetical protein
MGTLKGPEYQPRQITVTLTASEYSAMVYLRDTCFPNQPYDLMCRKLIQDGLIASGVLELPKANRSKHAGRR